MGGTASKDVPKTMKRLEVKEMNEDLSKVQIGITNVDVPIPRSGQVLVKMVSAPINPSDYGGWKRPTASGKAPLMGKEGSGIVVASGGGIKANSIVGKRVGVILESGGTYSQYCVADAMTGCFNIPDQVATEDVASFFVNPYTACGFVDTVKGMGQSGFVHTAAASQLGQMLVKLCKKEKITLINVVRRQEQADLLKSLGAENIIISSEDDWEKQLQTKMSELKISTIFDAIAGDNTGTMVACLPSSGTCFVYGGLSGKGCCNINPMDLIYKKKKVTGWFLTGWLRDSGTLKLLSRIRWSTSLVMPALVKGGWAESKFDDCSMEEMWPKFLEMWNGGGFTNKKLRIRMDKEE